MLDWATGLEGSTREDWQPTQRTAAEATTTTIDRLAVADNFMRVLSIGHDQYRVEFGPSTH